MSEYTETKLGIIKDGHTMFNFDIVRDLNRKSHLEALTLEQQQEITKLKLALSDINEHDDEITGIETTNQELSTLVEREIAELKAQVNALVNVLSGARKAHLAPHTYYCKVNSILNETPAQCLQSVKADAVDDVYDMIATDGANIEDAGELIGHTRVLISVGERANKLREGKS